MSKFDQRRAGEDHEVDRLKRGWRATWSCIRSFTFDSSWISAVCEFSFKSRKSLWYHVNVRKWSDQKNSHHFFLIMIRSCRFFKWSDLFCYFVHLSGPSKELYKCVFIQPSAFRFFAMIYWHFANHSGRLFFKSN